MIQEVRLPEISENVESGDVIKVLVSTGDVVDVDQPLLELETDKAVLELPSPFKGKVAEILVKMGETIKVGQLVMRIDTADTVAASTTPALSHEPTAQHGTPDVAAISHEPTMTHDTPGTSHKPSVIHETPLPASPAVRRLARELGVDLRRVKGSGGGSRILEDDVKAYARQSSAETGRTAATPEGPRAPASGRADAWGPVVHEPMSKVRQVTARTVGRAWTTIPHVTHYDQADITALDAFQKKHGAKVESVGGKLTITAVLLKVAASALKLFPGFNASIDIENNEIVHKKYYHIGVAVDTDRGLLVPVIRDVDKKNVTELSVELTALSEKARARKIAPEELEGGTFTVSNLGGIGGTGFSPIVYAPQVAILGVARARTEPVYIEDRLEPRLILPLSVSYDHRVIDGADGARFLRWIVQALEEPFLLSLEG